MDKITRMIMSRRKPFASKFSMEVLRSKAQRHLLRAVISFPESTKERTLYQAKKYAEWEIRDIKDKVSRG
jgi:hypothetical protein